MICAEAEFIAHAATALVIRRRVHNGRNYSAPNKLVPASDQKVIGAEFDLASLLPQPDESTRTREQNYERLRIWWHASNKIRLGYPGPGWKRYNLLC